MPKGIVDRVRVLRSKNAGPFVITFDVIFGTKADFESIKQQINPAQIAKAYGKEPAEITGPDFVDELNAMKFSLQRKRPCGHPGDSDCYGMNQEQPLALLLEQLSL